MVMTTTSLATVKAQLSAFVESVHGTHERVVITRNGEPAAVLISPDDLESLEETIAILSDPEAMTEIGEARKAIAAGDLVDISKIVRRSSKWHFEYWLLRQQGELLNQHCPNSWLRQPGNSFKDHWQKTHTEWGSRLREIWLDFGLRDEANIGLSTKSMTTWSLLSSFASVIAEIFTVNFVA
jgi:antitoxin YefM